MGGREARIPPIVMPVVAVAFLSVNQSISQVPCFLTESTFICYSLSLFFSSSLFAFPFGGSGEGFQAPRLADSRQTSHAYGWLAGWGWAALGSGWCPPQLAAAAAAAAATSIMQQEQPRQASQQRKQVTSRSDSDLFPPHSPVAERGVVECRAADGRAAEHRTCR